MMKASGGFGTSWITDLFNNIVKEGCILNDWRNSILVPVYKEKGDPLLYGSFRAIRLLEQPINVTERVLEKRISYQVLIGDTARIWMDEVPRDFAISDIHSSPAGDGMSSICQLCKK